jgi:hypothetical protein
MLVLFTAAFAGGAALLSTPPVGVAGEVADFAVHGQGALWLAAAAWQPGARVWTADGAFRAELQTSDGEATTALATSPDGRLWVGFAGGVHAYPADLSGSAAVAALQDIPRAFAFLPDGDALIAGQGGGLIRLDGQTLAVEATLAPGVAVTRLAVDPAGKLAVGCSAAAVHLIQVARGRVLASATIDGGACVGVGFATNGDAQAMTSRGALLRLDPRGRPRPTAMAGEPLLSWDRAPGGPAWAVTATGEVVRVADDALFTDRIADLDEALAVRVSADGSTLVTALRGGGLAGWSARDGEPNHPPRCAHGGPVTAVAAPTAAAWTWSAGVDGDLLAWWPDGRCQQVLDGREGIVGLATSADGGRALVASARQLQLLTITPDGPALLARPDDLGVDTGERGTWSAVALSPDGRSGAAAGVGTGLLVVRPGEPTLRHRLDADALALAWRPDGGAIAALLADGKVRVVDAAKPGVVLFAAHAPEPAPGEPARLVFLPDGRVAVSVGARLLVTRPGFPDAQPLVPPGPSGAPAWIALSVDGGALRAVNTAGEAVAWSLTDLRELSRTAALPTQITAAAGRVLGNVDGVLLQLDPSE